MDVLGTPVEDLGAWLATIGVGATHAGRVFRGLHDVGLEAVPNLGGHAQTVREQGWFASARVVATHPAERGNERLVFELFDGARVEGVLLPNDKHPGRTTLCLSSQVGCAMACRFCATGTLGLSRQLRAGEIVAQVQAARARVQGRLTHLVFMGMGEPLHNYRELRRALSVLFDPHGQPFARDRVTVSTVGLPDRIRALREDFGGRVQLALSLHAGTDAVRETIVPIAKKVRMAQLREAVQDYTDGVKLPVLVEYVLLPGVNDTVAELEALADWMDGIPGVVNLIPFNPYPGAPYRSPTRDEIEASWKVLKARGVRNTVRWPRGRDASGACGQLMLADA